MGDRDRADGGQNPADDFGKVLRVNDDGSIPKDNPFVGRAGYRPEIYTLGQRNQQGLAFNPVTASVWASEHGPNGGDEINVIMPGRNYGWPIVSYGRNYAGPNQSDTPAKEGIEQPIVFWVPSIAVSGMSFYTGDKFPAWKDNVVRRRAAHGRNRSDRPHRAHRVQRRMGGDPPRAVADGTAPAHPRRSAGSGRAVSTC